MLVAQRRQTLLRFTSLRSLRWRKKQRADGSWQLESSPEVLLTKQTPFDAFLKQICEQDFISASSVVAEQRKASVKSVSGPSRAEEASKHSLLDKCEERPSPKTLGKETSRTRNCSSHSYQTSRSVLLSWMAPLTSPMALLLLVAMMSVISAAAGVAAGAGAGMAVSAKVPAVKATEAAVRRPPRTRTRTPTPAPASASPPTAEALELSTEFFLVPDRLPTPTPAPAPHPAVVVATRGPEDGANRSFPLAPGHGPGPGLPPGLKGFAGGKAAGRGLLRREPWVIPLLVFASLCMLCIAGFEVFVLCKARRTTPSRRHLFLGQMLLLGLFLCAGVGGVLAAAPTPATCAAVRFGAGVASALVFAALLVKCVFLISLNGGVYLPAPYQALLLLFAVLIQVAVGLQWLLNTPPQVDLVPLEGVGAGAGAGRRLVLTADDLLPQPLCRAPFTDVLLSLLYVACLIAFVAVLAVKSRGIRDNYREATFIGLSVACVVPIWLVWAMSGLVVSERHRDACLAFGLVATAAVVFLVMFMPKGRQLAAMGKDGVYVEDREERFSTLSRAGSGYSPSFYHFKPIKYSAAPLAAAPVAPLAAVPHKQQAPAVTTVADRVALVAAPSYTRMYHYYPYCYYPGGVYVKPEDGNMYTTLEPTLSSNPNVFFQRSGVHPGMMY